MGEMRDGFCNGMRAGLCEGLRDELRDRLRGGKKLLGTFFTLKKVLFSGGRPTLVVPNGVPI